MTATIHTQAMLFVAMALVGSAAAAGGWLAAHDPGPRAEVERAYLASRMVRPIACPRPGPVAAQSSVIFLDEVFIPRE
jgi:hypothetical protein